MPTDPAPSHLLAAAQSGEEGASERLVEHLYQELRVLARQRLRQLRPGDTLNTTALVHEAWLRLAQSEEEGLRPSGRDHFLALASRAMRFVLVDHARARSADKRGGGRAALTLDRVQVATGDPVQGILDLNRALDALTSHSPRLAAVVEYRFFGGLTHEEIGGITGQSVPTVKRDWARARAWLLHEMEGGGSPPQEEVPSGETPA